MPLVLYTLWRIVLFVAALGAGYLVGMRGWLLLLIALLVAFAVSYLALRGPRDAAALYLAERAERRRSRERPRDEDAEYEDSVADQDDAPAAGQGAESDSEQGSGREG